MKYLRLAITILLALGAQCSFADSSPTFQITQATMSMGPNNGSGDNLSFVLTGPGVTIAGIGGMACFDWCSGPLSSPGGSPSQIFVDNFGTAILGGIGYFAGYLSFNNSLFDMNGGLNPSANGFVGEGASFIQFALTMPTDGRWALNFGYVPPQDGIPGYYVFTHGEFSASQTFVTPEPGAVGLMLTGLAGIAGIIKRKTTARWVNASS
jgi:hypothetical protein